jgi:serine/threonine-protein kinase HipA
VAKQSKQIILYVSLNGMLVGQLKKATNGQISFKYDDNWLAEGFQISNSLPLQEDEYKGQEVSRYFDNLLPDNAIIKRNIATKFGAESTNAFDMLKVIGKDCVGALSFTLDQNIDDQLELNYRELSEAEIARKIKTLSSSSPLGMDDNEFRISIAGAQEKTALLNVDGQWYEPLKLTPTTHIFKTSIGALGIDINFNDSIDNEWISLKIMQKLGIDTCHSEISQFEDQRVLVVKRFDRRWVDDNGKKFILRIPQEDMCQALGYSPFQKYQSDGGPGIIDIAKLLNASTNQADKINFFKTILIFDLLVATDGHAKNFSLFQTSKGFRLTPIYDVMSGYFLHARENMPYQKMKLAMKVGNSGHYAFKRITQRHYLETAKMCDIAESTFYDILSELKQKCEELHLTEAELDPMFNKATLEPILEGIQKRSKIILE